MGGRRDNALMDDAKGRGRRRPRASDLVQPLGDITPIFHRRQIAVGTDDSGRTFLARPQTVLVDSEHDPKKRSLIADRVARWDEGQAAELRTVRPERRQRTLTVRLPKGEPRSIAREEGRWSLEPAQRLLDELRDDGIQGQLNTVVFARSMRGDPVGDGAGGQWVGDHAFPGVPTTDTPSGFLAIPTSAQPAESPPFFRRELGLADSRTPKVLVLDTGLATSQQRGSHRPQHHFLSRCHVHTPWETSATVGAADDEDEIDDDGLGLVDYEAGHGTFIAGVIRQICPDAEIDAAGVLSSFGDGDIGTVLGALRRVLPLLKEADRSPDLVVMSFGGYFPNDDPGAFGAELLELLGDAVGVAAAGNDNSSRPQFPAALPGVIAVGALGENSRAYFSNYGCWVDACAPAIDVVSTFFTEAEEVIGGTVTRRWEDWARWSGTSFSAPKVAAAIAQEMYLYGGTAKDAWGRLSTPKHFRYPDLGVVVNV